MQRLSSWRSWHRVKLASSRSLGREARAEPSAVASTAAAAALCESCTASDLGCIPFPVPCRFGPHGPCQARAAPRQRACGAFFDHSTLGDHRHCGPCRRSASCQTSLEKPLSANGTGRFRGPQPLEEAKRGNPLSSSTIRALPASLRSVRSNTNVTSGGGGAPSQGLAVQQQAQI